MKVVLVSTFPPRRCGIGDYTADLAGALVAAFGTDISVLTYGDGAEDGAGADRSVTVDRRLGWARTPRRLESVLREVKPDAVHVQSATFLHPLRVNAVLARTLMPCPLVTTVHDAPSTWRTYYAMPALREIYRRSSRLFVHSHEVARTLTSFHGIEERKTVKVPHGVDTAKYRPDVETGRVREKFGLGNKRVVLFFGFLRPGKGIPVLLKAWSRIHRQFPDTLLIVAGGTVSYPRRYKFLLSSEASYPLELRRLARRLGIENRMVFTGYVLEKWVPSLLATADAIALPYDGSAPQSGPLHKALSSGRPVVATSLPASEEVIGDRQAALLVPPGDVNALSNGIRLLLEDSTLSQYLGGRAREFARDHLGWEVVAKRTFEVYGSLQV